MWNLKQLTLPLTPKDLTTLGAARIRASITSVEALLRIAVRSGSIPYLFFVVSASIELNVWWTISHCFEYDDSLNDTSTYSNKDSPGLVAIKLCTKVKGGLCITATKSGRHSYDDPMVFETFGSAMSISCALSHLVNNIVLLSSFVWWIF